MINRIFVKYNKSKKYFTTIRVKKYYEILLFAYDSVQLMVVVVFFK